MKYIAPEVEILELLEVDIICTSVGGENPGGGETGDGTDDENKVPTPGQNQPGIF